jgi:two-component sensor histidine kinase
MDSHRVLLVDDDQLICISLAKGLERRGYSVTTATNGNQAVAVLETQRFEAVVADLVMAGFNGLGVLKRSKELHPETSVIILTAFADLPSAIEALRLGADDYVSKPCDAAHLSSLIARCAEKQRPVTEISRVLATKELILRETHHRVKNDFLMLSALVGLQLSNIDTEAARLLFEELRTRIQTMCLVHEELFRGRNYQEIGARRYVSELCRRTAHSFNPHGIAVSLTIDALDENIETAAAIPMGLIINELITNSMRHAFDPGGPGHIFVTFGRTDDEYRIEVRDDGRGMVLDTAIENTDTLGMKIVVALTSQLRGTIQYRNEDGVVFTVSFPVKRGMPIGQGFDTGG